MLVEVLRDRFSADDGLGVAERPDVVRRNAHDDVQALTLAGERGRERRALHEGPSLAIPVLDQGVLVFPPG